MKESRAANKKVPVPPPELILQTNVQTPVLVSYTMNMLYGGSMGLYMGTVASPVILGQRHQQIGFTGIAALLGAMGGGLVGYAYSAMGQATVASAHALIHYQTFGLLTGVGLGNFFGSRGNARGPEFTSGFLGSVGGTLLAFGMKSGQLTDHGSLLWGGYAAALTAAGTGSLGILKNFDGDATLGLVSMPAGIAGILTSLILAPIKPDPVKAGVVFLTGSALGASAAILVGGMDLFVTNTNETSGNFNFPSVTSSQAWAGLAGATMGLFLGPPIYEWIKLRWLDSKTKRKRQAKLITPWSTILARSGPSQTQPAVLGIQWQFE